MDISQFIEHKKKRLGEENFSQKHLADQMGRDPSYICKMASFKAVPSLMMSIVLGILSNGKVKPRDLITPEQLRSHLEKKDIKIPQEKIDRYWSNSS